MSNKIESERGINQSHSCSFIKSGTHGLKILIISIPFYMFVLTGSVKQGLKTAQDVLVRAIIERYISMIADCIPGLHLKNNGLVFRKVILRLAGVWIMRFWYGLLCTFALSLSIILPFTRDDLDFKPRNWGCGVPPSLTPPSLAASTWPY